MKEEKSHLEAALYAPFGSWVGKNWGDRDTAVFELKRTHKRLFNKNLIETHQIRNLKMASSNTGAYWKIADEGFSQKLWDCQIVKKAKGYLVICFDRRAYLIDIWAWLEYMEDRISLTEEECASICSIQAVL